MTAASPCAAPTTPLAAAFSLALESFTSVNIASDLRTELETSLITLCATRLRLSRWGMSNNVYNNPRLPPCQLGVEEAHVLTELGNIHDYLQNVKCTTDGLYFPFSHLVKAKPQTSSTEKTLAEKISDMCNQRQSGNSGLQMKNWTIQDREELSGLTGKILASIQHIESLSPRVAALRGLQIAASEARQLSLGALDPAGRIIQTIQIVDPHLVSACRSEGPGHVHGHTYRGLYIKGGIVVNGDRFADYYVGGTAVKGNTYDGMVIENAQVLNGNMYGGLAFMPGDDGSS